MLAPQTLESLSCWQAGCLHICVVTGTGLHHRLSGRHYELQNDAINRKPRAERNGGLFQNINTHVVSVSFTVPKDTLYCSPVSSWHTAREDWRGPQDPIPCLRPTRQTPVVLCVNDAIRGACRMCPGLDAETCQDRTEPES